MLVQLVLLLMIYYIGCLYFLTTQPWSSTIKRRRTQHYGSEFNYKLRRCDDSTVPSMPSWVGFIFDRIPRDIYKHLPNQLTINEYNVSTIALLCPKLVILLACLLCMIHHLLFGLFVYNMNLESRPVIILRSHSLSLSTVVDQPGKGIAAHVDTHSAFYEIISSLSLLDDIVMRFEHRDGRHKLVNLPRRSLLIMDAEARYVFTAIGIQ